MGVDIHFRVGERVLFKPKKGKVREGVVEGVSPYAGTIFVTLEGDPFPMELKQEQVSDLEGRQKVPLHVSSDHRKVPRYGATKKSKKGKRKMTDEAPKGPDAKELRKQAQALGVKGWEDMGRKALTKAIKKAEKKSKDKPEKAKSEAPKTKTAAKPPAEEKPKMTKEKTKAPVKKAAAKAKPAAKKTVAKTKPAAKKATAKKTPAKKAAPKKKVEAAPGSDKALGIQLPKGKTPKKPMPDGENPFRKSANLYIIAEMLLKGGTRKSLAERLSKKVKLHPYNKPVKKINLKDYDKRIMLCAQTMRDVHGYGFQSTGRGLETGKIKVFVPGGPNDPRSNTAKGKSKKK